VKRLVLGTAGHVDHGKTRLVRALTGVDTDRLAEEKARGITIDLGFARLIGEEGVEVAIVDVPGHESFVRNMLAGATGMDAALLVVAADEGVMPQTREHLAIVDLLGVSSGVVALTKVDLVDTDWRDLVLGEVRELLSGTGLEGAEILPVSAAEEMGLERLAESLGRVARGVPARAVSAPFRLPVDRAFTVRGTGTVVTGTVADGTLADTDTVRVLPGAKSARVRALQSHGQAVDDVRAGQRAAVAVAGVERGAISRGDVLVKGEAWRPHGTCLGTAEVMARVVLLDAEELRPGRACWAQLRLERPGVARAGDRFVLRSYSPVTTIGGGTVVEPLAGKRNRLDEVTRAGLTAMLAGPPAQALAVRVAMAGWEGVPLGTLPVEVPGADPGEDAKIAVVGDRALEADYLRRATDEILAAVERHHEAYPLSPGLDVEEARRSLPARAARGLADAALAVLTKAGKAEVTGGVIRRRGYSPRLRPHHRALRERVLTAYGASGLAPTPVGALAERGEEELWPIVKLLEREGLLYPMGSDAYVSSDALSGAMELVRSRLGGRADVQPGEFRELFGLTRKNLIPLLEHFDRIGLTRRTDEGREVRAAD
jgi:selenocysteine-specific elongation factor